MRLTDLAGKEQFSGNGKEDKKKSLPQDTGSADNSDTTETSRPNSAQDRTAGGNEDKPRSSFQLSSHVAPTASTSPGQRRATEAFESSPREKSGSGMQLHSFMNRSASGPPAYGPPAPDTTPRAPSFPRKNDQPLIARKDSRQESGDPPPPRFKMSRFAIEQPPPGETPPEPCEEEPSQSTPTADESLEATPAEQRLHPPPDEDGEEDKYNPKAVVSFTELLNMNDGDISAPPPGEEPDPSKNIDPETPPSPPETMASPTPGISEPANASDETLDLTSGAGHETFDLTSLVFDDEPSGIYEAAKQLGIDVPESKKSVIKNAKACLDLVFKKVMDVYADKDMIWPMIKSIATDIEGIIAKDDNILLNLQRYRVNEEKLLWHSLYTAILAMDLAMHMDNLDTSVDNIGGAALLHDIGLLSLSGRSDILSMEDDPQFRIHSAKSRDLANEIGVPEQVARIIYQHHERLDGSGFPDGIGGDSFPRSSQIVAIANVFEKAVINISRENREASSGASDANGLSHIFKEHRRAYDNQLLKKIISLIGYYPVGCTVELSNRSICEVIRQNEGMPLRPVVKVIMDGSGNHPEQEKTIDLKNVRILSVTRTVGSRRTKLR